MAAPFRQRFPLSVSSARAILRCRGTVAAIIARCLTAGPVAIGQPSDFFGAGVTPGSALGVTGEQDPGFPDPRAEADWIARALRAQAVMVPRPDTTPQSQRPDITTAAVLRLLESVTGRAQGQAHPAQHARGDGGGSLANGYGHTAFLTPSTGAGNYMTACFRTGALPPKGRVRGG